MHWLLIMNNRLKQYNQYWPFEFVRLSDLQKLKSSDRHAIKKTGFQSMPCYRLNKDSLIYCKLQVFTKALWTRSSSLDSQRPSLVTSSRKSSTQNNLPVSKRRWLAATGCGQRRKKGLMCEILLLVPEEEPVTVEEKAAVGANIRELLTLEVIYTPKVLEYTTLHSWSEGPWLQMFSYLWACSMHLGTRDGFVDVVTATGCGGNSPNNILGNSAHSQWKMTLTVIGILIHNIISARSFLRG